MGEAPKEDKKRVQLAVFDYDGTCIDGQSGALFSLYLFRHNYLGVATGLRLGWWGARYKLHLPYRQDEAREVIFSALSRYSPEEIRQIMVDFHNEVLIRRYRKEAIAEVAKRKREGCVTVLVSATFEVIALCAQEVLGTDAVIATKMEVDPEGNYTGRVEGDVTQGSEKPRAVKEWADGAFGPDNWEVAYAYGDHFSDYAMLKTAKHGYAVTPGQTLERAAKREGFPILEWK